MYVYLCIGGFVQFPGYARRTEQSHAIGIAALSPANENTVPTELFQSGNHGTGHGGEIPRNHSKAARVLGVLFPVVFVLGQLLEHMDNTGLDMFRPVGYAVSACKTRVT